MSIEQTSTANETQAVSIFSPIPGRLWRFIFGLYVLIMPAVAFWATDLFRPEWQNGELDSYLILLLSPAASWIYFPLLAFSILSYLFLIAQPARYSQIFIVRLGVYMGVLLALHFSIVSGIYFLDSTVPSSLLLVLLWLSPLIVLRVYPWIAERPKIRKAAVISIVVLVIILTLWLAITSTALTPFMFLLALLTIAAPVWCFLIFLRAAIWLLRNAETAFTIPKGLGLAAWLGLYAVAWRVSILKMYELYAALPPEPPPDCYIATAAARGHAQFVGSRIILRANGTSLMVNRQLQILKFAEMALIAVLPGLHKVLRRIYDVIGQFLARKIQNPFLADFAYVLLKPFETLAVATLRRVIPEFDELARKLYIK